MCNMCPCARTCDVSFVVFARDRHSVDVPVHPQAVVGNKIRPLFMRLPAAFSRSAAAAAAAAGLSVFVVVVPAAVAKYLLPLCEVPSSHLEIGVTCSPTFAGRLPRLVFSPPPPPSNSIPRLRRKEEALAEEEAATPRSTMGPEGD